ncbi:hypothetical protein HU727_004350 [Pseudomonas sp. SWRI153]|uniref:Uncharacterized protein n=1 Tax=Pseudomonas khorasanensis TaxID=2745508 RepID=A0A923F014_9PSED|nr:hypothetical protein [Pseudomonas khorasanensis]MBV4484811.1 hypothetical protein [Pseudomonas khorasanensis]
MTNALVIAKVIIPGWVTPVDHPGKPEGGVPLSLRTSQGLQVWIDPWLNMSSGDNAKLLSNGSATGIGKTIQPGEENKRFILYLPDILNDGINGLQLAVTRLGSSTPETSAPRTLLYNLPRPGGEVSGSGDNPFLYMTLPIDVVTHGVDAARAAKGVDVTLRYTSLRAQDVITLQCDGRDVNHTVTTQEASAGLVVITLFTNDFWQDNPRFTLRYRVTDQLGNTSGPDAIWSSTTSIDVHVKQPVLDLLAPKVLEAKEANGTTLNFEKDFYDNAHATVVVNYLGSNVGQTVRVQCIGRAETYLSDIQPVTSAGQILTFRILRRVIVDSIGHKIEFKYTVRLPGTTEDLPSKDLDVSILRQKHLLGVPTISSGLDNLRLYAPNPLEAAYTVRISLTIDGQQRLDSVEATYIQGPYMSFSIPPGWVSNNRGKTGYFNYSIRRTSSSDAIIFSPYLKVSL